MIGLQINAKKTKLMCHHSGRPPKTLVDGKQLQRVDFFHYQGIVVSTDGGAENDILIRTGNARAVLTRRHDQGGPKMNT